MIDYNAIGCCIDDVFHNTTSLDKKVTASLSGDVLTLKFIAMKQHARGMPLDTLIRDIKEEAIANFKAKVKSMKTLYRENTGTTISIVAFKDDVNMPPVLETYTVSSVSPKIMYKTIQTQRYTIK